VVARPWQTNSATNISAAAKGESNVSLLRRVGRGDRSGCGSHRIELGPRAHWCGGDGAPVRCVSDAADGVCWRQCRGTERKWLRAMKRGRGRHGLQRDGGAAGGRGCDAAPGSRDTNRLGNGGNARAPVRGVRESDRGRIVPPN
jgi:hypothetical protein